jgi:hypothetical protein
LQFLNRKKKKKKILFALSEIYFATGWWFSPDTPVSSTNKTDATI